MTVARQLNAKLFSVLESEWFSLMLQNFALGKGDEEVIGTLQHFAKTMEEVSALHAACTLICLCAWVPSIHE